MDKKGFQLVSALLKGKWLIHPEWADQHIGLAFQILEGTAPVSVSANTESPEDNARIGYAGRLMADGVAEIEISGPMLKYGGWCSAGTMDYIESLGMALQDDRVRAVLLKVDSPGGEVRSIGTLNEMVSNANKPVVVFVEDLAASAALYSIAGADYIFASHANTEIGSIGVYQTIRDYSQYFEKAGVKDRSVYSRLSTEKNGPYRAALEGNDDLLQDDLDYVATEFISAVKAGRGDKLNTEVSDPFKGKVYFAPEALKVGLIDAIGDYQTAIDKALDLASDSNFIISKNQNNMFGDKYASLTALRGIAATNITEDQLVAANAALDARGLEGIRVVNAAWIQEAEDLQESANASSAEVTRLTTELATATADRDKYKALAEKFGGQPSTVPAAPQKSGSNAEITDDSRDSHLCEADVQLAELKKQAGLV